MDAARLRGNRLHRWNSRLRTLRIPVWIGAAGYAALLLEDLLCGEGTGVWGGDGTYISFVGGEVPGLDPGTFPDPWGGVRSRGLTLLVLLALAAVFTVLNIVLRNRIAALAADAVVVGATGLADTVERRVARSGKPSGPIRNWVVTAPLWAVMLVAWFIGGPLAVGALP